ncbi:hypothetical protein SAMN05444005_103237 [Flavobacterium urocaniciphilum]|uniref:Uncharacterized protein n=1 Tax=Flavobacterium urocaniciphilum TaxID=1299341 RepID=A0A1H9BW72_9FLAO|nr:hypothetical protein SAMN05444005_103237 [Flavobacterium urocaniciphilum]
MKKTNLIILIGLLIIGFITEVINGKIYIYNTFDIIKICIISLCLIFALLHYKDSKKNL